MSLLTLFARRRIGDSTPNTDMKVSAAVLQKPIRKKNKGNTIEKGVLLLNRCDMFCEEIPDIKDFFYLVERNGWYGANLNKNADIKLVEDLRTLEQTRHDFPNAILLEFANADFVDTDIFRPLEVSPTEKKYTGIQISAWEKFKRHDLFVTAAALLPEKKFIKFGHFWNQGPQNLDTSGIQLKRETVSLSKKLGADIEYPFEDRDTNDQLPVDSASMNVMINKARMGILTTEKEGVNRFKMECLSANIPFLVPEDVSWPTKKHINDTTGIFFKPTPKDLANAIRYVEDNYAQFSPRKYILSHTGIHIATEKLKEALRTLAVRDGSKEQFDGIFWDGRNASMLWVKETALAEIQRIIDELNADSWYRRMRRRLRLKFQFCASLLFRSR
jgi:glycosyltransferase involved in cell wall biosynthesis